MKRKEENVKNLSADIDVIQNNKMLKLCYPLFLQTRGIIEYRDNVFKESGCVRCPVCGSASFGTMEKDLILKEADDYIRQNGENVKSERNEEAFAAERDYYFMKKVINCAKM